MARLLLLLAAVGGARAFSSLPEEGAAVRGRRGREGRAGGEVRAHVLVADMPRLICTLT